MLNMPHVYLVQPAELVGTNRYKLGMSSLSNLSRVKSYKVGTRYLCIFEQVDALATERKLKRAFCDRYRRIAGLEYFEVNDEAGMVKLFMDIATSPSVREPVSVLDVAIQESLGAPTTDWLKKYAYVVAP